MNINIEHKSMATHITVPGLKGLASIWYSGNCIAASMDHIPLLPAGAVRDVPTPSYYVIRNPTPKQVAEFIGNIASQ